MRRVFSVRVLPAFCANARFQSSTDKKIEIPEDPKKRAELYQQLSKKLEENKKALDEKRKEVLYAAADAENSRRKYRDEIDGAKNQAILNFGKDMIEISDSLISVCRNIAAYRKAHEELPPKVSSLFSGVELSLKVVDSVLGRHGIKKVDVEIGSPYNPDTSVHTFTEPPSDIKPGCVTEVIKQAYSFDGKIIRHAEVGIAEEPEKKVQ